MQMNETKNQMVHLIPKLRRYARALISDIDRADDLVQDTLTRALSRLELWKPGTDLRAWLFTIMHNVFVNDYKKNSRTGIKVSITEANEAEETLSYQDSPINAIELNDCIRSLMKLPIEQREVILLVALEGLRYTEVAEVMGVPVGTVMSRLSRGRNAMRVAMEGNQTNRLKSVK